jgi:hypothetical protein
VTTTNNLKRAFLYSLVMSVILAAVLGITLVLRNQWGEFEIRVILTTLTVAAASVGGLACDISRARKGWNLLPAAGLILTAIAVVLVLVGVWSDRQANWYWKTTVCFSVFAIAAAHACLLSVARLPRRFSWVLMVAYQIIFGLATLIAAMIIWDLGDQRMFQWIAAVSILDAGCSLLIPVLHRLGKTDPTTPAPLTIFDEKSLAVVDGEIVILKKRIAELEKLRDEITYRR